MIPADFDRYVEPFLGAGALFWDLARPGSLLSDSNPELIHFYTIVRNAPEELLEAVAKMPVTKEDFYAIRAQDPQALPAVNRIGGSPRPN